MTWGVGVIGGGPGVAALHLPTLDRVADLFTVVHLADLGSGRAAELAARIGASASQGTAALLADPAVEVVAICSPPSEHSRQIRECIAAGVRAILCEKPLATTREEAREVVEACRDAGVVILVGTNHFYDEAWERAKHHLVARNRTCARSRPRSRCRRTAATTRRSPSSPPPSHRRAGPPT